MPDACSRPQGSCTDCGDGSPIGGNRYWIGLDVGVYQSSLCAIDEAGVIRLECTVETNAAAVHDAVSQLPNGRLSIAMESGAASGHLTRRLRALSYLVTIYDARKVKRFLEIRRNKTDVNDARGLAEVARYGEQIVSEVRLRSEEGQRLRSQMTLRRGMIEHRKGTESLMRSLIQTNGGRHRPSSSARALEKNILAELCRLKADNVDIAAEILPLLEISLAVRRYVERMDAELTAKAEANPICRRFMAISGVSSICALSFFAAIEDPTRFGRLCDVGSYLGLVPRLRQSGTSRRTRGITKMGDSATRRHLVQSAMVMLSISKQDSELRRWGVSLSARIGGARARVAVARKLAVLMLSLWKSGSDYEPFPNANHSQLLEDRGLLQGSDRLGLRERELGASTQSIIV